MWFKSFGQCSLPYQSYLSTETPPTLINNLPTPPDVRGMSLTLNTAPTAYMCVLNFLSAFLCVSVCIFACVGVSALPLHTCRFFPCMSLWTCQSLSPVEPIACVLSDRTASGGEKHNHPSRTCKKSANGGQAASQPSHS